jgi:hypothetical protein
MCNFAVAYLAQILNIMTYLFTGITFTYELVLTDIYLRFLVCMFILFFTFTIS